METVELLVVALSIVFLLFTYDETIIWMYRIVKTEVMCSEMNVA